MSNEYFLAEFCDKERIISQELNEFYTAAIFTPSKETSADLIYIQKYQINSCGEAVSNGQLFNIE
jgi:hypothetical protein